MSEKVRLYEKYKNDIVPFLQKELNLKNSMEVPKVKKIIVNTGIGEFRDNESAVEAYVNEISALAGQRPSPRKARKSIAGFGIKQGDVVGYAVTLRKTKMWVFLDKLINIVLPRVRDFAGLSLNAFDQSGNYSIGIDEHTIFPEINPNEVRAIRSLQVTIVTDTDDTKMSYKLLSALGMPFKKDEQGGRGFDTKGDDGDSDGDNSDNIDDGDDNSNGDGDGSKADKEKEGKRDDVGIKDDDTKSDVNKSDIKDDVDREDK